MKSLPNDTQIQSFKILKTFSKTQLTPISFTVSAQELKFNVIYLGGGHDCWVSGSKDSTKGVRVRLHCCDSDKKPYWGFADTRDITVKKL